MSTVAHIGRHEVLEGFLVDMLLTMGWLRVAIVLNVNPTKTRLHGEVLLEDLVRRETLRDNIAGVKDQHQRRMVHLTMDLCQNLPGLTHQIRLDLQAKS